VNKKVDGQRKRKLGKEAQRGKSLPREYNWQKEKRKTEELTGES
jgi:hypothetical protein